MSQHTEHNPNRAAEPTSIDRSAAPIRICQGPCASAIPANRLAAQPNALFCVPCLEAAGDVLPIKRFDEMTAEGEQIQTLFVKDRRLERQINHRNRTHVVGAESFNVISGADEHLEDTTGEILDGGRTLATAVEEAVIEPEVIPFPSRKPFRATMRTAA